MIIKNDYHYQSMQSETELIKLNQMVRPKKNLKQSKNDSDKLSVKNPNSTKSRTLFDYINHIRESKTIDYYDKLTEVEKKGFNKYTLLIGLSMDIGSIDTIAYLSKYFELIPNKQFYTACCDLTPVGKKYCKWIKSSGTKFNGELLELLSKYFQIGQDEVKDYCKILFRDENGISYIHNICQKCGKTDKEIERLLEV